MQQPSVVEPSQDHTQQTWPSPLKQQQQDSKQHKTVRLQPSISTFIAFVQYCHAHNECGNVDCCLAAAWRHISHHCLDSHAHTVTHVTGLCLQAIKTLTHTSIQSSLSWPCHMLMQSRGICYCFQKLIAAGVDQQLLLLFCCLC